MESLTIEIINPKAKKLLEDLADINLITITKSDLNLDTLLSTLRKEENISLEEITQVEAVRTERQNEEDGWDNLTNEQQQGIFDALESIKMGKGITHEEVMNNMKKILVNP